MATTTRTPINNVMFRGYACARYVRLCRTAQGPRLSYRYSYDMSSEPFVDDGFPERWAAWQARGAANNRATRRRLFVIAAIVLLSVTILGSVWTF